MTESSIAEKGMHRGFGGAASKRIQENSGG